MILNRCNDVLNEFYSIFGYNQLPKRYIISLLNRGISQDSIFTIGTDAISRNNIAVKNKHYYENFKGE